MIVLDLGDEVPDLSLPDVHGVMTRLPVSCATVVYFTSNRCPSAMGWQQRLADVATDYRAAGVRVIAVNVPLQFPGGTARHSSHDDGVEGMKSVIDMPQWAGITYLDGTDTIAARAWGAQVTPDVFVVDRCRRLRYRGAPDDSVFEPDHRAQWLRDALDAVLEGADPPFVPTNQTGGAIRFAGVAGCTR